MSVGWAVAVGLAPRVGVSGDVVASGVGVSAHGVDIASGVEGIAVASGDSMLVGVADGGMVGVGDGVAVLIVEVVNGPPLTVTVFICTWP